MIVAGRHLKTVAAVAMALALAATPAYVIRPHFGPLPTTLLEISLVIAIVLGMVALRGRVPWRNPYTLPAAVFLLGATLDVFASPSLRSAAGFWKAYFIEPALAALVIAGLGTDRRRRQVMLAGLWAGGIIVAGANLGADFSAVLHHSFRVVTPPVAIYTTANAVALYLVPLDAIALALLLYSEDLRERLATAVFLVVTVAAVLASYSRGGWLALFLSGLLVAMFHRRRLWIGMAAIAVTALIVGAVPSVRQRIAVEFNPTSPNNTIRLRQSLWESSLNLLEHRPLFGGGLGGFVRAVEPYRVPSYHESLLFPHNIVLNFWTETGLLGLAGFVWLSVQMVITSVRALASSGPGRVFSIGILGAVLAIWVHGMVDAPYFKNDLAVAFWAVVGFQLAALRAPETAAS